MKNQILSLATLLISQLLIGVLQAQTPYKISFNGTDKRVQIFSAAKSIQVIGIAGTDVIIEAKKTDKEIPEEAEGLKIVSGGLVDNTGVGAQVTVKDNLMKIIIPKSTYLSDYVVKIPQNVSISIKENGNSYGLWNISSFSNEVEVQTTYTALNIKDVKGPIVARCGYGKLNIVFSELNQTRPNSISGNGVIDITLPSNTKANLRMKTNYADVFTDFDITPMQNQKDSTSLRKRSENPVTPIQPINDNKTYVSKSSKNYSFHSDSSSESDCNCDESGATIGMINGGGVDFKVHSDYGNIYLRKKK